MDLKKITLFSLLLASGLTYASDNPTRIETMRSLVARLKQKYPGYLSEAQWQVEGSRANLNTVYYSILSNLIGREMNMYGDNAVTIEKDDILRNISDLKKQEFAMLCFKRYTELTHEAPRF